ncbi:uncharacterized protein ARMOST_10958 [Armillaria ostoyae]|uniref:Uncharacterized protein n=1 Tax=Armillaria ostoyae TaxID=47428 RepID=A0A284RFV0_ARMOS|nr:uncharacterized protein ARMOST_10958 [Armillaria ostoyae]
MLPVGTSRNTSVLGELAISSKYPSQDHDVGVGRGQQTQMLEYFIYHSRKLILALAMSPKRFPSASHTNPHGSNIEEYGIKAYSENSLRRTELICHTLDKMCALQRNCSEQKFLAKVLMSAIHINFDRTSPDHYANTLY